MTLGLFNKVVLADSFNTISGSGRDAVFAKEIQRCRKDAVAGAHARCSLRSLRLTADGGGDLRGRLFLAAAPSQQG